MCKWLSQLTTTNHGITQRKIDAKKQTTKPANYITAQIPRGKSKNKNTHNLQQLAETLAIVVVCCDRADNGAEIEDAMEQQQQRRRRRRRRQQQQQTVRTAIVGGRSTMEFLVFHIVLLFNVWKVMTPQGTTVTQIATAGCNLSQESSSCDGQKIIRIAGFGFYTDIGHIHLGLLK